MFLANWPRVKLVHFQCSAPVFYSFSQTAVGLYGEERNMPIPRHEGIIKNKLERRMCVCVGVWVCVCRCVCARARTPAI